MATTADKDSTVIQQCSGTVTVWLSQPVANLTAHYFFFNISWIFIERTLQNIYITNTLNCYKVSKSWERNTKTYRLLPDIESAAITISVAPSIVKTLKRKWAKSETHASLFLDRFSRRTYPTVVIDLVIIVIPNCFVICSHIITCWELESNFKEKKITNNNWSFEGSVTTFL